MSDTPRTDENTMTFEQSFKSLFIDFVDAGFAQQLERELAAANKQLEQVYEWIERHHPDGFIDSGTFRWNLDRVEEHQHAKLDALEEELATAKAKSEERRALLVEHEYVDEFCPECDARDFRGHKPDCDWARAMKD